MKRKRIIGLLGLAAAVCLATSSTLRADITSENTNFIDMAYQDLLQRSPSPTDVANGLLLLGSESRETYAFMLDTSTEYRQLLVQSYVQDLLGRAANPTDLSFFVPLLSTESDQFVQAQIAGSLEFFLKSGGTDADFVTALFKDFLNRTPTSTDLALWVGLLGTKSRNDVATLFLESIDYDRSLVSGYFLQYLRRPAGSTELNFFANDLNGKKVTDEQVIASLIGSDEYFNLAQPPPPAPTPEPQTSVLLGLGLAALILLRRQSAG